jgi:hypothetical protein
MIIFILFARRHWYLKKRFIIPTCLLTTLFIGAIILGSVLGTRSKSNVTGTIFDILFGAEAEDGSICKS